LEYQSSIQQAEEKALEASRASSATMQLCEELRARSKDLEKKLQALSQTRAFEILVVLLAKRKQSRRQHLLAISDISLFGCFNAWRHFHRGVNSQELTIRDSLSLGVKQHVVHLAEWERKRRMREASKFGALWSSGSIFISPLRVATLA
jgi:hypothetical protein